jgi:SAM-dependent methyltransferase
MNYIDTNKKSWNTKADIHISSAFYDVETFVNGKNSLKDIELNLLGDVKGKSILHLQCHFGQDTLSLARMGANVTGIDLSDRSIQLANELAEKTKLKADFICCNIYDLPQHLNKQFDIVFTSYGTIGWLPDLEKWAALISNYLKPGGEFIFVEFHPVVWMFDDDFEKIGYNYFNTGPIIETYNGTYADKSADISQEYVMWNHGLGEVINSIVSNQMQIVSMEEFNYSPYDCFRHTIEISPGKFRINKLEDKIPMVYALRARKEIEMKS